MLVSIAALVVALRAGHGAWSRGNGLLDAGAVVGWALPIARTLTDLAIVALFGQLVLALLLPLRRGALAADARGALRAAAVVAFAAAFLMASTAVLTLADIGGYGLATAFGPGALRAVLAIPSSSYLVVSAGILGAAGAAAAWAAGTRTRDAAVLPLVIGAIALLPIALTGHADTGRGHLVAITALGVHLLGVCLWVGGLGALAVHALRRGRALASVLPRYSRVAAVCFTAVGISGIANAATRLTGFGQVLTTDYGRLVLAKSAMYGVLGLVALGQRRGVLPRLAIAGVPEGPGPRRAFARLAAVEVLLMGATLGLGVALSRTPTPGGPAATTNIEAALDYAMPPPLTAWHLVTRAWFDPVFVTLGVLAVALYAGGVRRLHRRGEHWPIGRSVAWLAGWAIAVGTTCSGLGRYGSITFSAHMAQHMLLSMIAPMPMVLGAPITLALRAVRPAPTGCRGPREWLTAALESRGAAFLGHPGACFLLVSAGLFGLYFSPVFTDLMSGHVGHLVMNVVFLASGYLWHWSLYGLDGAPVIPPARTRLGLLGAAAVLHAVFALALSYSTTVIASSWYSGLAVPWVPSLIGDQHLAGTLTWEFGELPLVLGAAVLAVRWHSEQPTRGTRMA